MKAILPTLPQSLFDQILIVDGGSTDGSVGWAKQQGFEVYEQKKVGLRHAYIEAWSLIRGDYVVTFSPDANCKPDDLTPLVQKLREGYDMVIASRYLEGARSYDDGPITALGNRLFTRLINTFHGGHYSDAMTLFRGYRTSLFTELGLHLERSYWVERFFFTVVGIEPLLSIRAARAGKKISEIPSDEPKRIYGERKLQIFRWGSAYLSQVLLEWVKPGRSA